MICYKDQILMYATYEKFYVLDIINPKPETDNIDLLHEKYYCYLRDGPYKWYGTRIFSLTFRTII